MIARTEETVTVPSTAYMEIYALLEALCNEQGIDLVDIATPPYMHCVKSKTALLGGKHVVCEKPAAIKSADAIELRKLAAEKQLLFVVNLIQR